jgi:periplasmic divalent cation tolerance protein
MNQDVLLACSTFPDLETARRIADQLVAENLVACVNLIPAIESIYRWEGKIERAAEVIAFSRQPPIGSPHFKRS